MCQANEGDEATGAISFSAYFGHSLEGEVKKTKNLKLPPKIAFRVEHGKHALDEMLAPHQSPDRVRDFRRLSKHKSSIQIICCYYTSGKFFQFSPYLKFNYSSVFNHH